MSERGWGEGEVRKRLQRKGRRRGGEDGTEKRGR